MRFQISTSTKFKQTCPSFVGVGLYMNIINSPTNNALWEEIEAAVSELRNQFTVNSLKTRPGILATRSAYKAAGKDPSRYRPACEQLARRILQGKDLYKVNTVVDLVNLVSLRSAYSTAALDADKIEGNCIELGFGRADEPYEGIGRGPLNIENLPTYRDSLGAFATPTSDSTRTMLSLETIHLLLLINAYDGNQAYLEQTANLSIRLLKDYADAQDISIVFF